MPNLLTRAEVATRNTLWRQIEETTELQRKANSAGDVVTTLGATVLAAQLLELFRIRYPGDPGGIANG